MKIIEFFKHLLSDSDEDDIGNESIEQKAVKNPAFQVDLGPGITDDKEEPAMAELNEATMKSDAIGEKSKVSQEHTKATYDENVKDGVKDENGQKSKEEARDDKAKNATNKETKNARAKSTAKETNAYNLIILDESGSMTTVVDATISGCNETLISIRNIQKEHPEVHQFVSIFCFDSAHSRYIFHDTPIEEVRDMTWQDYKPNACTPLYDAIGYTVIQLFQKISPQMETANVTIITDGYENASRKWKLADVQELIATLKEMGWVFSFIGANIDVESMANSLGIDSYMEFEQTDRGMSDMFERERTSRRAYNEKRRYMAKSARFQAMSQREQNERKSEMNGNYFVDSRRIAPDKIVSLDKNEIFVFGSNVDGAHNGSAALYAVEHFGAVMGQAEGIQGQGYAIPTDGNSFEELKQAIERFTEYVVFHPKTKFMLTAIGTGNAGYTVSQIAPLFRQAYSFGNVYVPQSFLSYVMRNPNLN